MTTARREISPLGPFLRQLPSHWRERAAPDTSVRVFVSNGLLLVITGRCVETDGKEWLHVSMSHKDKLPSWEEMLDVRQIFTPLERTALQVLPPPSKYVNVHPYCLHLWVCMEGDVTPDFAAEGLI